MRSEGCWGRLAYQRKERSLAKISESIKELRHVLGEATPGWVEVAHLSAHEYPGVRKFINALDADHGLEGWGGWKIDDVFVVWTGDGSYYKHGARVMVWGGTDQQFDANSHDVHAGHVVSQAGGSPEALKMKVYKLAKSH